MANVADVERLFREVKQRLGGLEVLVNNAGIAGPTAKVEDIRTEDWDRCIAVDLNGMFYCTRQAMPMIKAAGGGSIINLSSIAGRFGFAMRTPYSAAKWAVVGFTQSLAVEAGPDKVRVNCIQPGIVEGERVERIIAAKAEQLGVSSDEILERMVEGISLKTTVTRAGHRQHRAVPRFRRRAPHQRPGDFGLRRREIPGLNQNQGQTTICIE